MKNTKFSAVELLDFVDFPMPNNGFADDAHLNEFGAERYSTFFNYLLENGLLQKINKQKYIDSLMSNSIN